MLNSNKTTNDLSTFSRTLEKSVIEEYRKATTEAIRKFSIINTVPDACEFLSDELIIDSIVRKREPAGVAWTVLHFLYTGIIPENYTWFINETTNNSAKETSYA